MNSQNHNPLHGAITILFSSLFLFSCLIAATPAFGTTEVPVYPGQDLESIVSSYPAGTTFELQPGIYRMQYAIHKNYDSFIGQSGVVLDGAEQLTSFDQSGTYWIAHVQVASQTSDSSLCDASHPACDFPEDLFFDDVPQLRVASLSAVVPGTWYLDYSTDDVYIGSDPAGHTVELSVTPYAFYGSATEVTISQLTIEKYASSRNGGAVNASIGTHWTVEWNDIWLNHSIGVRIGSYMWVYHNRIHENGEYGMGGTGNDVVVQSNEIDHNNYAGYVISMAGGTKFVNCYNLKIQYNNVHNNGGPGLWTDINNDDVLIEHNDTSYNIVAGIFVEISYNETIRYNYITNDGFNPSGTSIWWGAGILVNSSPGIQIYGNIVKYCMNGIGGIQTDRGTGTYGPYLIQNLNVYGNTITQVNGTAEGIVKSSDYDDSIYTSWNNHFQNDTYYLSYPNNNYFYWLDAYHTLAWWDEYDSLH